jgi:Uma2 family endonuclease
MVIAKTLLSAEAFALLADHEQAELIDGEVIPVMPTFRNHGRIVARLIVAIEAHMDPNSYIGTETGVVVSRNPDRVRGPDVLYVSAEKILPQNDPEDGFWEIQPDLVAEVVPKNETAEEVRLKLRDYLSIQSQQVLLIYSITKEVEAHSPDGSVRKYKMGDVLEFPQLLPGFRLEISELFMPAGKPQP